MKTFSLLAFVLLALVGARAQAQTLYIDGAVDRTIAVGETTAFDVYVTLLPNQSLTYWGLYLSVPPIGLNFATYTFERSSLWAEGPISSSGFSSVPLTGNLFLGRLLATGQTPSGSFVDIYGVEDQLTPPYHWEGTNLPNAIGSAVGTLSVVVPAPGAGASMLLFLGVASVRRRRA